MHRSLFLLVLLFCHPSHALAEDPRQRLASLKGPERLALLLDLTIFPDATFGQNPLSDPERIALAQEALQLARSLKDPGSEAKALWHLGLAQVCCHNPALALEADLQALEIYTRIPDLAGVTALETELGHVYQYGLSDYAQSLYHYRRALETARRAKDTHHCIKNLTYIGDIYLRLGEYKTAAGHLSEAVSLDENSKVYANQLARGVAFIKLSEIHLQLEDIPSAMQSLNRGLIIFERPGNYLEYGRSRVDIQLGHIHRHQKQYDEALADYRRALEFRLRINHDTDLGMLYNVMAETEREAQRLPEAAAFYERALALRRKKRDLRGVAESTLGMGLVLAKQRHDKAARSYFTECLELSQGHGFRKEQTEAYLALSELHESEGDMNQALRFRRLFEEWKNRVQGPQVAAEVLSLTNHYEKAQRERELELLKKRHLRMLLGYGSLVVLLGLLVALLLHNLRRIRKWTASSLHRKNATIHRKNATIQAHQARLEDMQSRIEEIESDQNKPKYAGSRLSGEQASQYIRRLQFLMESERLFRDPDLSLSLLAQRLNLNTSYLSQVFNQHLEKKFLDFVNEFRLEEAKRLLSDPLRSQSSALEIGLEAGFNSKSNYYRLFKEATGLTPIEYRRTNLSAEF